eukprot:CAMPEP_0206530586 /NCGR_PEP_ID=MMETSP0325_2-20121206/3263_1 /ASSEMBLY_ACC=CAM_ASM_000347 /TAXON_ID=2866 /ORGANISM="Crypthecodinium cohnii, Strain Seligo" /LENGTH=490 /DNA_ID=CAMNT_0054026677 /DNA_START=208 /DNA_END=1677 /DNA_ORIENTATION=-
MREFLPQFLPDSLETYIRDHLNMPFYNGDAERQGGIHAHGFHFSGAELCMMLILIWTLLIVRELRCSYETHSSVWVKARQGPKTSELVRTPAGRLVLRSISIALLMLVGGSYFIVAADNISDLILNALSLEFIIHTDELIYSVLAPKNLRMIVSEVHPLQLGPVWRRFRSLFKVVTIVGIIFYVMLVNRYLLLPVITNMKIAMTTMCGGDINFVARRYSDGVVRTVDPVHTRIDSAGKAIPMVAQDKTNCSLATRGVLVEEASGTWELRHQGDMLLSQEDIYLDGKCEDRDLPRNVRLRLLVQDASGNHFLKTCEEARHLCGHPPDAGFSSTLVRAYCPQTCGCATAAQFFTGSGEGCPLSCKEDFETMLASSSQCMDMTVEMLDSNPEWHQYLQSVVLHLSQRANRQAVQLGRFLNTSASVSGCAAFRQLARGEVKVDVDNGFGEQESPVTPDFCSVTALRGGFGGAEHRSVRFFCPTTCGCAEACAKG